ncbi:MAG: DUF2341 domain-containing protein, partial [Kiritimatiellae bacterium]|nr:DUF2341 domain-containing protein [Kiritimatiellia bacterium]
MAAAVCLAVPMANAADSLTMADFGHKIKLQVSGYTGTSTLANFPVLVRISETRIPGFDYDDTSAWNNAHTTTYGYDVAFFAEDGTRLASEIDTWVHNGVSLAWVTIPQMTQGTKFYMCYNVASGVMVENPNPWGDYVGVWHLREPGGTSRAVIENSTTYGLLGMTSAKGSPAVVNSGKIGAARRIATDTGNNPGYDSGITVALTNSADLAAVNGLAPQFTASFWYCPEGNASNWEYLMSRKNADGYNAWGIQFGDERTAVWGQIRIYGGNGGNYASNAGTYGTANSKGITIPDGGDGVWRKMDCVWTSDAKYKLYQDGVLVAAGALSGNKVAASGSLNLSIGGALAPASGKGGRGFKGIMDEARLRPGVVSDDWVKADYDTAVNESFVTVVLPNVFTITWDGADGTTPGLKSFTHKSATFAGTVEALGEEAASCAIQYKVWADGESEPADWTTLTNGLVAADTFEVTVTGLTPTTAYNYALRADNGVDDPTTPVTGSFTTESGLTIAWSDASGSVGIERLSYGFVIAGGSVTLMGVATRCNVLYKVWADGESEPGSWTTLAANLGLGDSFSETISDLEMGKTYQYKFMGVGDADEETTVLSGTFTTLGSAEETVGSAYTHFFDDGTNAVWVANEFERYLPFTVTGYTGTETLTNFPVLVEVRQADTNGFKYDDFYHYDGSDIAFVDEKGHIIPHEIDTWNKNGMSLFWVRLPEMNNGTTFTMCYRSPLLETRPDPGNVFEPYVGVWHMNERGDGVVNLKDSSVNDFETETHAMSTADNNGRIGYARRVAQEPGSSSSFGRIIAFDHDNILRTGVGNVFTFSGWYKLAATPPKWSYLVSRKSEDADMGWGIQYEETDSKKLRVWSGSSEKNKYQLFETKVSGTGWHYWTFIYDGSVNPNGTTNQLFHAYVDGVELASTTGGFALNYPVVNDERAYYDHLVIGGMQNGTGAYNGLVDEARYSKGMRSADWIKAEYDSTLQAVNWNNAAKRFVTKGTVSRGVDSLVPVVVWERGAGLPDTILDVSYAYVQFAGTVTYCGAGANECRVEYQIWVDGENKPAEWTTLASGLTAGRYFSIPVTGLKQDMLYNFTIRAVNVVDGQERQNYEHAGQFRTNGNMVLGDVDGELFRLGDKFVHRFRSGAWTFTTPDYVTNVEIMVVGGGGAGGYKVGGGGGGGGVFHSLSFPVTTSTVYRVQVGKGGIAASNLTERSENGELSYFALLGNEANPLIRMHGGGAGGSYVSTPAFAKGADGASGGGGTYAQDGGVQAMLGLPEEFRPFGNIGGRGNDTLTGGSIGKV